jgi:chromosome partitioning protein
MIVTIVNCAPPAAGPLVAENIAVLRARRGRKVLLLDATRRQACERWGAERARARLQPPVDARAAHGSGFAGDLERVLPHYDDVVIDTDADDGLACRSALIAAHVALVPLAPRHADAGAGCAPIARLNSARMFNPGLRVLFVAVGDERDPAERDLGAVRACAAQVMSAGVAAAILHLPALLWGADDPGRCAGDIGGSAGAAEMAALLEQALIAGASEIF